MSSIKAAAELIIQCCDNYKAYWEICRRQKQAIILAKLAKRKAFYFFGKPLGYQKAFEIIRDADYLSYISFHMQDWENETDETVKYLRLLAENGNPVTITTEEAFIFNFKD